MSLNNSSSIEFDFFEFFIRLTIRNKLSPVSLTILDCSFPGSVVLVTANCSIFDKSLSQAATCLADLTSPAFFTCLQNSSARR